MDEKLPELEPRVSHSFVIKVVSTKKLLKVFDKLYNFSAWLHKFVLTEREQILFNYDHAHFGVITVTS